MKIRLFFRLIVPVFFAYFVANGCTNEKTCNEYTYSTLRLHFYKVYNSGARTYVKDSVLTSIRFFSGQFDTIAHSASTICIPLSQNSDSTAFLVQLNSGSSDTVYLKYKRDKVFLNYECGFRTDFTIDTIVSKQNRFDSIEIVKPKVSSVLDEDHIKIYFFRRTN
jgi:hypothetical protein